jgi:DnaJ-class molecular chaperone
MSVGGEYVGKEPCPQCHGTGQDYQTMLGKVEKISNLPLLSKKETAIVVFDKMLDKTREERLIKNIYCRHCKGQRLVHVREDEGKYLGQKPCPYCYGTGKDYKAMYFELAKTCMKDYMAKGHSIDDAWKYCTAFFHENKEQRFEAQTNVTHTFHLQSEKVELNFPSEP